MKKSSPGCENTKRRCASVAQCICWRRRTAVKQSALRTIRARLGCPDEEHGETKILTIGFTKKSAETFFTRLKNAGVKRLVDVRLNKVSQLKAKNGDWQPYERQFLALMRARHIESSTPRETPDGGCLLWREEKPPLPSPSFCRIV